MSDKPGLGRVRQRVRRVGHGEEEPEEPRLVADADPDHSARKKRKPNSGSFKRGEPSRNPSGRPKGAKGAKAAVRRVLTEKVKIRTTTGARKVTLYEALVLKERELALQGDWRARKTMLELGRWAMPEEAIEQVGLALPQPSEADRVIIEWFEEEVREKNSIPKQNNGKKGRRQ